MRNLILFSIVVFSAFNASCNSLSCPAFSSLARTCYNRTCEPGENRFNCPEDCADRDTQVVSYYGQSIACEPTTIYEPTNMFEAQEAMRQIVSQNHRVKVVGHHHSGTDIICSDGDVIETRNFNHIGEIERFEGQEVITIEAGVKFADLQQHLHDRGKSIGMTVPGYGQITIVGGLGTGLHGSSPTGVSSISNRIVAIEVMDPGGNLTWYSSGTTGQTNPNQWKALRTHLGLLGFITRVKVRIEDEFNLDTTVSFLEGNEILENGIASVAEGCDYMFFNWFPDVNKAVRTCGRRTGAAADPTVRNALFTPATPDLFKRLFISDLQLAACNPLVNCTTEKLRYLQSVAVPNLWHEENGEIVRGTHGIGYAYRITTMSEFPRDIPRFSQIDWEFSVPERDADEVLKYIYDTLNGYDYCLPLIGVIVRFDQITDDTLLGNNAWRGGTSLGERVLHIELPTFIPYEASEDVRNRYFAPVIEIMEHVARNYRAARFHWGKNQPWVFSNSYLMTHNRIEREYFQEVIDTMDPYGVFQNEFSRRIGFTAPHIGENFSQHYYPNVN